MNVGVFFVCSCCMFVALWYASLLVSILYQEVGNVYLCIHVVHARVDIYQPSAGMEQRLARDHYESSLPARCTLAGR